MSLLSSSPRPTLLVVARSFVRSDRDEKKAISVHKYYIIRNPHSFSESSVSMLNLLLQCHSVFIRKGIFYNLRKGCSSAVFSSSDFAGSVLFSFAICVAFSFSFEPVMCCLLACIFFGASSFFPYYYYTSLIFSQLYFLYPLIAEWVPFYSVHCIHTYIRRSSECYICLHGFFFLVEFWILLLFLRFAFIFHIGYSIKL